MLGIWLFGLEGGWLGGLEMGGLGLTDRDEGSNAEAAREMLETGDWISPTLNYEPRFAKPAFTYWLISASYSVFGVNEFAARFPSALSGLLVLLVQYAFVYRWLGAPLALFSSIMLLLNFEFLAINRMVITDPELVVFTTLAGYSFWHALNESSNNSRWWFMCFYVAMGFGMLVKGPVGIIIPLVGAIPYLTLTRQWKKFWHKGFPVLGPIIILLVAAPWYMAMIQIHADAYWAAAQANTTGRFMNPMEGHGGTLFFYVPILLLGFFPWSAFLPSAVVSIVETVESLLEGKRIPYARKQCRIFSQPMGSGFTHLLYVLGHAFATLYLPVVSSRSNISCHVVETLSRYGCSARLANLSAASSRYWLSFRNCAPYCSVNFPSLHQANQ